MRRQPPGEKGAGNFIQRFFSRVTELFTHNPRVAPAPAAPRASVATRSTEVEWAGNTETAASLPFDGVMYSVERFVEGQGFVPDRVGWRTPGENTVGWAQRPAGPPPIHIILENVKSPAEQASDQKVTPGQFLVHPEAIEGGSFEIPAGNVEYVQFEPGVNVACKVILDSLKASENDRNFADVSAMVACSAKLEVIDHVLTPANTGQITARPAASLKDYLDRSVATTVSASVAAMLREAQAETVPGANDRMNAFKSTLDHHVEQYFGPLTRSMGRRELNDRGVALRKEIDLGRPLIAKDAEAGEERMKLLKAIEKHFIDRMR
jgi:hypothetical protein